MRKDYDSCSVCLSVCLSVTMKSATYRKQGIVGFFMEVFVVALAETLRSKVLVSFADCHCFPRFLMSSRWTEETTMASFQHNMSSVSSYNMTDESAFMHWYSNVDFLLCVCHIIVSLCLNNLLLI